MVGDPLASVLVVGGGIGGLAAALDLGRAGHPVTLIDRDDLAPAADVEAAFVEERRGAPQARHTHGLLSRLLIEVRTRFPDVYDDLLAAGGTVLPLTRSFTEVRPGDDELAVLASRRTTVEWVLRRAVAAEPNVEVRGGAVAGLLAQPTTDGEAPMVEGIFLADGTEIHADVTVVATGRRSTVPEWLAEVGVEVHEELHQSGLIYLTRWYRRPGGVTLAADVRLAADHGFVKYLAIPGDGDTFSITLGVKASDTEMRAHLTDPAAYHATALALPGPASLLGQGEVTPDSEVMPMGGLINRLRRFRDTEGRPTVLGLHVLGDAHTCTNPIYGRGCSLALIQSRLLTEALADHPAVDRTSAEARAMSYETASEREVEPWFTLSVQGDAMGADPGGRSIREQGSPATGDSAAHEAHRAIARVFAAGGSDPVVGRGILRLMNMLATPSDLMADTEFLAQAMTILGDPDTYPVPPPPAGPTRADVLAMGARAADLAAPISPTAAGPPADCPPNLAESPSPLGAPDA